MVYVGPLCPIVCSSHEQSVEQLQSLWTMSRGDSGMGCMPRASHSACVLSRGTKASSGDRMAKNEKSEILGSSGVWGASARGSCLAFFTLGVAGVVMTYSAGVAFVGKSGWDMRPTFESLSASSLLGTSTCDRTLTQRISLSGLDNSCRRVCQRLTQAALPLDPLQPRHCHLLAAPWAPTRTYSESVQMAILVLDTI